MPPVTSPALRFYDGQVVVSVRRDSATQEISRIEVSNLGPLTLYYTLRRADGAEVTGSVASGQSVQSAVPTGWRYEVDTFVQSQYV